MQVAEEELEPVVVHQEEERRRYDPQAVFDLDLQSDEESD